MNEKAELTFEIEETVVLKQGGGFMTDYCSRCEAVVDMLSPDVLSLVTGVREREIFRLIENGRLHFVEAGRVYVCGASFTSGKGRLQLTKSS